MGNIFDVLRAGSQLANSKTWKNRQLLVASLTLFLSGAVPVAAFFGYKIEVTAEDIGYIAGGVGVVVGLFNGWATVATTTTIGLPAKLSDSSPVGADGAGHSPAQRTIFVRKSDADPFAEYQVPILKPKKETPKVADTSKVMGPEGWL